MKRFTIGEVEGYSKIRTATLRMWGKRYGFCKPQRDEGGNREYNLEELELILNVALLSRNGYRISVLAQSSAQVIKERVESLSHPEDKYQHAIDLLIIYKFSDIDAFERQLNDCFSHFGIEDTLNHIIVPFLEKVNILSYSRSTNEVHLTVNLIRRKLIYCIESLLPKQELNKTALLFLPEGEHYDLMLLYMCYLVKSIGLKPIYLGTNIAEQNLLKLLAEKKPDYLYTYISPKKNFNMIQLLSYLQQTSPEQKVNVVFNDRHQLQRENINYIHYTQLPDLLLSA
jgi:DNA-binding transcriptional MerR regulator